MKMNNCTGSASTPRTRRLVAVAAAIEYRPYAEQARRHAEFNVPADVSPFLAAAQAFAHVYPRLTPVVRDDELIVGARLRASEGDAGSWLPDGSVDYAAWFAKNAPADRPDIQAMAARGLISPQGSFNHKVPDYAGFIRCGSAALARRARALAAARQGEDRDFALGFALGHEAMIEHARTYAIACNTLAESATPRRARELRETARLCGLVPALPATTFREALQSFWFAYMVAGDATGRIDLYLADFYQADLVAGRITPAQALELIECLLIKLHGDGMEPFMNVSSVQTLTLGGVLPDGRDATNELTRLFLTAIRNVRLLRPTVYVRCHDTTPTDVLDLAVAMLGDGLAEPQFYNDRPILEGLTRLGLPLEVARDYALSGCAEVVSPGRGNWGAPNGWINLALLVDEALRQAAQAGVADTTGIWAAVERHIDTVAEACRVNNIWVDEHCAGIRCAETLLMPVCLDRCRDIGHGGLETHFGHWEAIGLPNAADMLHAALRLSADDGESLASLFERLDAGDPGLFAQLRALPKFGNACAAVDKTAARLVRLMADALECRSTPLRKALVLGHLAGGENMHIGYGLAMGPTLDGRRAGQTLADSLAGTQGRTLGGPTAVIRSLCRLDHSRLVAGNVSTLRLNPTDFATAEARQNVVALIRTFISLGGSQMQINVADADTLHRAQADPDEFRGTLVRVAGYSADFTRMGKRLQDEIIARTEGLG